MPQLIFIENRNNKEKDRNIRIGSSILYTYL